MNGERTAWPAFVKRSRAKPTARLKLCRLAFARVASPFLLTTPD
jgi:hypothetical protein